MFHAPIHTPPSPIAAQAILAQIEGRSDCNDTFYAKVDGAEWEFEAWFSTDWNGPFSDHTGTYFEADCTLVGACSYDDDGNVSFAGSKAETVALIGEKAVAAWEYDQAAREMEGGE